MIRVALVECRTVWVNVLLTCCNSTPAEEKLQEEATKAAETAAAEETRRQAAGGGGAKDAPQDTAEAMAAAVLDSGVDNKRP